METRFYNLIEEYQNKGVSIEAEVIGIRPCEGQIDAAARQKMFDYVEEAIFHACGIKPGTGSSSTDCNIPLSLGFRRYASERAGKGLSHKGGICL